MSRFKTALVCSPAAMLIAAAWSPAGAAVGCDGRGVARGVQALDDERGDAGLVLDDQDAAHRTGDP